METQHLVSPDPQKAAAMLENNLMMLAGVTRGTPNEVYEALNLKLMTHFMADFKAQVIEELLASQNETNTALAAALGMIRK